MTGDRAAPDGAKAALLDVRELSVDYRVRGRRVPAVAGVSLSIAPGETLGLVGESGSGKTTLGRAILGLVPVAGGRIAFDGQDITGRRGRARRGLAKDIQVVFQDPYGSLNPAMKVSAILRESLRARGKLSSPEARRRVRDALEQVALPATAADRYPGAFSGGQRQRLAIARALMPSPRLVICDEAVSALDLSVQGQILNLLRDLQQRYAFCYLFIGHDLGVVRFMSHRVIVLYRGRVVEEGPTGIVARQPRHPYTRALVAAIPAANPGLAVRRTPSPGRAASSADTWATTQRGCPFAPRCQYVIDVCTVLTPPLTPASDGGAVACHRYPELPATDTPN
jgi:oligopeptide/dipeptide ABC transporter ATP-binding protein